jgi:hypothetical protein
LNAKLEKKLNGDHVQIKKEIRVQAMNIHVIRTDKKA